MNHVQSIKIKQRGYINERANNDDNGNECGKRKVVKTPNGV